MTQVHALATLAALVLSMGARGMTLEEAGKNLGAGSPELRNEAVEALQKGGFDSLAILDPLLFSPDEGLQKRARQVRGWILFGLNDEWSPEMRDQILSLNLIPADQRLRPLMEILRAGNRQPVTLAHIHSRILEMPIDGKTRADLGKRTADVLRRTLSACKPGFDQFDPRLLDVRTRALVCNQLASRLPDRAMDEYVRWLEHDPELRRHLDRQGIRLELARMKRVGSLPEALGWLPAIQDGEAAKRAVQELQFWWKRDGVDIGPEKLTEAQTAGYLQVQFDPEKPEELLELYQETLERHPGLADKLSRSTRVLEVHRLLKLGEIRRAFELAVELEADRTIRDSGLEDVGRHAAAHIDDLPHGLPWPEDADPQQLREFLKGFAPSDRNAPSAEIIKGAERFNQLDLNSPPPGRWAAFARKYNIELYLHVMALRNELHDLVVEFEEEKAAHHLRSVGQVLGEQPEYCRQIGPNLFWVETLRNLLAGFCGAGTDVSKQIARADTLAREWEKPHPDLLRPPVDETITPLLALRLQQAGKASEAIRLLAGWDRNSTRNAQLVAAMLSRPENAGLVRHFDAVAIPTKFIASVVRQIQGADSPSEEQIEVMLELSGICRRRPDCESNWGLGPSASREMAFRMWLDGRDELVMRLLEHSFWHSTGSEEFRLEVFPLVALATGRIDEALAGAAKISQTSPQHDLKLAYLLRAADRPGEALEKAEGFPQSDLYPALLREAGRWQEAGDLMRRKIKDYRQGEQMRAMCACFEGDFEAAGKHFAATNKDDPGLLLMLDRQNEVAIADFRNASGIGVGESVAARMARESVIIPLCEDELITAIEKGRPVPYEAMRIYYEHIEHLPDRDRALHLAEQLYKQQTSRIGPDARVQGSVWAPWVHKTMAISAICRLGKLERAIELTRDLLGDDRDLERIPSLARWAMLRGLLGFGTVPIHDKHLLKLAALELPDATAAEQLELLATIVHHAEFETRFEKLLELARRHQQSLTGDEVTELLRQFARHLGQPEPADGPKEKLLADFSPVLGPNPLKRIGPKVLRTPREWSAEVQLGKNADPRADEFAIADGVARVKKLSEEGGMDQARQLMQDITLRLLLDRSATGKKTDIMLRAPRYSSSFHPIPQVTALVLFRVWEIDPSIALPATRILATMPVNYAAYDRLKWASEVHALHGNFPAALQARRERHYKGASGRPKDVLETVSMLLTLEIRAAVQQEKHAKVLEIIRRYLQIDPYRIQPVIDALKTMQERGDTTHARQLDEIVTGFWQTKLLRLPRSRVYQRALDEWRSTVGQIRR